MIDSNEHRPREWWESVQPASGGPWRGYMTDGGSSYSRKLVHQKGVDVTERVHQQHRLRATYLPVAEGEEGVTGDRLKQAPRLEVSLSITEPGDEGAPTESAAGPLGPVLVVDQELKLATVTLSDESLAREVDWVIGASLPVRRLTQPEGCLLVISGFGVTCPTSWSRLPAHVLYENTWTAFLDD